jgi:hypothetical protein
VVVAVQVEMVPAEEWRKPGRPADVCPPKLVEMLERTGVSGQVARIRRDDPGDPITSSDVDRLRRLLEAAALRLGGRALVQSTKRDVQFRLIRDE